MSKVYKHLHSHNGATVNPGRFAHTQVSLSAVPNVDDTIIITWNSVARTYSFVNDERGTDWARSTSARPTSAASIGTDTRSCIMNLAGAIKSNLSHVEAGSDDTFLPVVRQLSGGDVKLDLYSHAKTTGNFTVGGTAPISITNIQSAAATTGAYSTDVGYTGIMFRNDVNQIVNVGLLMKKSECSGRLGPPENDLEKVTVALKSGELYEIETYGCDTNCTLFG